VEKLDLSQFYEPIKARDGEAGHDRTDAALDLVGMEGRPVRRQYGTHLKSSLAAYFEWSESDLSDRLFFRSD